MKRKLFLALFLLVFAFTATSANALTVVDVSNKYWAKNEIAKCLEANYLSVTPEGKFEPENTISRLDFVVALLKVLRSDDLKIIEKSNFKDINDKTKNQDSILALQQLRIIYGYPDKTFRPEIPTKRSEATSAIGNITKQKSTDSQSLDRFTDKDQVPAWVKGLYAKNVENGLYVNYPNEELLRPNDYLTRAEAAVLLVKISNNLELIEAKYRGDKKIKETLLREEHLNVYSKAPRNTVGIYNVKNSIEAGNVLEVKFDQNFDSKKPDTKVGDGVNFVLLNDLYTDNQTLLLPSQTRINAKVARMQSTRWKNKNYKALVVANKITLPSGETVDMAGVPYTKKTPFINRSTLIKPNSKKTLGEKVAEHFGKGEKKELTRADFLVRYSEQLSPNIRYKEKIGNPVYILLTGDLNIPAENK